MENIVIDPVNLGIIIFIVLLLLIIIFLAISTKFKYFVTEIQTISLEKENLLKERNNLQREVDKSKNETFIPTEIEKFPDNPKDKGLFLKYVIMRADGTPLSLKDEYFVLKVRGEGDPIHIKACRKALLYYAKEISKHLPILSNDIIEKYQFRKNPAKNK